MYMFMPLKLWSLDKVITKESHILLKCVITQGNIKSFITYGNHASFTNISEVMIASIRKDEKNLFLTGSLAYTWSFVPKLCVNPIGMAQNISK